MSSATEKFHSIQLLRAVAALMVVLHHARNPVPGFYDPIPQFLALQSGVDIFFVISGFIMFTAAAGESWQGFALKRVIRIAPLYWIANGVKFVSMGIKIISAKYLGYVALSLAFIPAFSLFHPDYIWPYLTQGWSLNFEMLFYAAFAAGLASGRLRLVTGVVIGLLIAAGTVYHGHSAVIVMFTSPIMLEFAMGAVLAQARRACAGPLVALLAPTGLALIALANGVFQLDPGNFVGVQRVVFFGLPAMLVVAGFRALEPSIRRWRGAGLVETIGNASYAIYLFQEQAIGYSVRIVRAMHLAGAAQFAMLVMLALVLAIGIGLAVHTWLERPILRLSRKWLLPARQG